MTTATRNAELLNEAALALDAYAATGLGGFRRKAYDRLRAAYIRVHECDITREWAPVLARDIRNGLVY